MKRKLNFPKSAVRIHALTACTKIGNDHVTHEHNKEDDVQIKC